MAKWMNKRGQVFLMAAVIIAGLVLGATKIVNSAKSGGDQEAFNDLAKEIDFETSMVLDYGVINPTQIQGGQLQSSDIQQFLSQYNDYIGGEEVVFIFGDLNGDFDAIYYQNFNSFDFTPISLNTGGASSINIPISYTSSTRADIIRDNNIITVRIRGIDYTFDLKEGQNFYFVLIKDENGEKYVAAR